MSNQSNYRIENIQKVFVNSEPCKVFNAYKKSGDAFIFVGQYSVPESVDDEDLWTRVRDAEEDEYQG